MGCKNVAHPYIEPHGGDAGHLKQQATFDTAEGIAPDGEFIDLDDPRVVGLVVTFERYNCFQFGGGLDERFDHLFGPVEKPKEYVIPNKCGDKTPDKEWSTVGYVRTGVFGGCFANGVQECDGLKIPLRPCVKDSFTRWPRIKEISQGIDPPDPSLWPSAQFYMGHGSGWRCPNPISTTGEGQDQVTDFDCGSVDYEDGGMTGNSVYPYNVRGSKQLYDFNLVWYRDAGTPPANWSYGSPWPDRAVGIRATFQNRFLSEDFYRFNFRVGMGVQPYSGSARVRIPAPWTTPLLLPVTDGFGWNGAFEGFFSIPISVSLRPEYIGNSIDWTTVKVVIRIKRLILDDPVWGNCCSPFQFPNGGTFDNDYPPGACYHLDPTFCSQGEYGLPGEKVFGLFQGGAGGAGGLCESFVRCNIKGACCHNAWPSEPHCEDMVSASDCQMTEDRIWAGPGTVCSGDPCPDEGACCLLNGDCIMQFEEQCQTPPFGFWWGALWKPDNFCSHLGIPDDFPDSDLDPIVCPVRGKCCCQQTSGEMTCSELEFDQCQGPDAIHPTCRYGGDGVACMLPWDLAPCSGACCVPVPSFSDKCEEHTWFHCQNNLGGEFFGFGRSCISEVGDPAVMCDQLYGACCIVSACYYLTAESCEAAGGDFNPDTCCADNVSDECDLFNPSIHCHGQCGCCYIFVPLEGVAGGGGICCNNVGETDCNEQNWLWEPGSCNMVEACGPGSGGGDLCDELFDPCLG